MIDTNITEYGINIEASVRESGVRVVETSESEKITYDENGGEILLEKEIVVKTAPFRRSKNDVHQY